MNSIKKIISSTFHSRFNTKLFFSYLALIAVPLIAFMGFCFSMISEKANQQSVYSAETTLHQTTAYLNDQIISYKNMINMISYDSSLQDILIHSDDYIRETQGNWLISGNKIGNIIYTMNVSNIIKDIKVYPLSGDYSFENSVHFQALTPEEKAAWTNRYAQIEESRYLWIAPSFFSSSKSLGHLQVFKKIPSNSKLFHFVGLIHATLADDTFTDILEQAAVTEHTSVILFNENHEIISHYSGNDLLDTDTLTLLTSLYNPTENSRICSIDYAGSSCLMGMTAIHNTDWSLLLLVPKADTLASNRFYLNNMFLAVILMIALLFPILIITSNYLSTGIQALNEHITKAMASHDRNIPLYKKSDEIGELTTKFNDLLSQVNDLLDAQYRSGYALKDLELQVLQSQINPHFLYNTLDMIYWLSLDYPDPRVSKIAKELGSFYKLSLGHGESIVTIKEELEHIKAYTAIQNIRFDNKITLVINVPDELLAHSMIKLILQPLVENAILHGIREKDTESGTITVTGSVLDQNILLRIADDGVGMTEEQVQILLSPPAQSSGYAIWNVEERLKLNYGPSSGLHFITAAGKGTTVEILMPL